MINRTDAWKCSDGTCFDVGDKERAYNHEIKTLLQSLPKSTDRHITASQLMKLTKEVEKWLLLAKEFNEGLKRTPRDRGLLIIKDFRELFVSVEEWLENSKSLLEQIKNETDVETKRAMAGQGG